MDEDVYFDASRKFREPRKLKKSSYKPKGKEYKYIDPAEGLIQQVETKIVKPKRMKKVKKEVEPLEKRLTNILESRRKLRQGREVSRTVDPEELQKIKALQERAIVPSTKIEMERQKERQKEEAQTLKEANEQVRRLLEENRHNELIQGLQDVAKKEFLDIPVIYPPSRLLDDISDVREKDKQQREYEKQLKYLNLEQNKRLRDTFYKWLKDNNITKYNPSVSSTRRGAETNDAFRKRAHFILSNYRTFKAKTGRGLFGGSLQNIHPKLAGALIAHDAIHRSANRVIASLPAKHKGIKELEKLKKMAKRSVLAINKQLYK